MIVTFTADGGGNGRIYYSDTTYAATHNSTAGDTVDAGTTNRPGQKYNVDTTYTIWRAFAPFNLGTTIPSNATIVAGTNTFVRAVGTGGATSDDSDSISLVASTQASNTALVVNDFDNVGTIKLATDKTMASWALGNQDFQLNTAGVAAVQAAIGGYVKFAWRTAQDIASTPPTGANIANMGNATNLLSVEYTLPGGFLTFM